MADHLKGKVARIIQLGVKQQSAACAGRHRAAKKWLLHPSL